MNSRRVRSRELVLALASLALANVAWAEKPVIFRGHIASQIQSTAKIGRVAPDESVSLSFVVRLDQTRLDQTVTQIYGPHSNSSRHFLTSQEFAHIFGLADKRLKLQDFARTSGLTLEPAEDRP